MQQLDRQLSNMTVSPTASLAVHKVARELRAGRERPAGPDPRERQRYPVVGLPRFHHACVRPRCGPVHLGQTRFTIMLAHSCSRDSLSGLQL